MIIRCAKPRQNTVLFVELSGVELLGFVFRSNERIECERSVFDCEPSESEVRRARAGFATRDGCLVGDSDYESDHLNELEKGSTLKDSTAGL